MTAHLPPNRTSLFQSTHQSINLSKLSNSIYLFVEEMRGRSSGFGRHLGREEQAVLSAEQRAKLADLKKEVRMESEAMYKREG